MAAEPASTGELYFEGDWTARAISERDNSDFAKVFAKIRSEARIYWDANKFPSTNHEDWKYTNLAALAVTPYSIASVDTPVFAHLPAFPFDEHNFCARLVFVNGVFSEKFSVVTDLPEGLVIDGPSHVFGTSGIHKVNALAALNTLCAHQVVSIRVADNALIGRPLQIQSYVTGADGSVLSPRISISLGTHSSLKVVEYFSSTVGSTHLFNQVSEYDVGEASHLDVVRVQDESKESLHISSVGLRQAAQATSSYLVVSLGAKLARNSIFLELAGAGGHATLNGVTLAQGSQHIDNATIIDHAEPHCESRESFRGVYSGKSKGAFAGTIIVREDAQKTNAFQSNQALLLSPDAEINSRPQLKIWADDVKCTHGATVGRLSQEQMYYLRARGLDKKSAERLLIGAFTAALLQPAHVDGLIEFVDAAAEKVLLT